MGKGIVTWIETLKGYGFVGHENGPDVFVHFRSMRADGCETLTHGEVTGFGKDVVQSAG